MRSVSFTFKQFDIDDSHCGMKVGTDAIVAGVLASLRPSDGLVLDVGAGSGIIALMLAQRFPLARISAVEIDPGACLDMKGNVAASPWAERIEIIEGDFSLIEPANQYDLIVSNPPFFVNGERSFNVSRAQARHADSLSAFSLLPFAAARLSADGSLAVIIPVEMANDVVAEAAFKRLSLARRVDVETSKRRGVTRSFLEFTRESSVTPTKECLSIGDERWRSLTENFYLK